VISVLTQELPVVLLYEFGPLCIAEVGSELTAGLAIASNVEFFGSVFMRTPLTDWNGLFAIFRRLARNRSSLARRRLGRQLTEVKGQFAMDRPIAVACPRLPIAHDRFSWGLVPTHCRSARRYSSSRRVFARSARFFAPRRTTAQG
jgi:hypothetical protein